MPAGLAIRRFDACTPARAQPVAARLALQALCADLEDALPGSLPPQSLLWLRRLELLAPEAALLRPAPAAWRHDWIAAGRERFDMALAQAARPALGPVPDSAPAVLFADASEMLACLVLAVQTAQLDRWWWRGLLGRAWPHAQTAWAARPEAQAAAARLLLRMGRGEALAGWGEWPAAPLAPPVVMPVVGSEEVAARPAGARSMLDRRAAESVPATASRAADEPATAVTVIASAELLATPQADPAVLARVESADAAAREREANALPAALRASLPAASAEALPVAGPLVSMLAPRIGQVPLVDGGAELAAATAPAAQSPPAVPALQRATPTERTARAVVAPPIETTFGDLSSAAAEPPSGRALPSAGAVVQMPAASTESLKRAEALGKEAQASTGPISASQLRSVISPAHAVRTQPEPPAPAEAAAPDWPWPQAVLSHQAPLLFVVNALLEDGLYPDFTRPRDPGLPVPLWALLAALGLAWRLPSDALCAALQQRVSGWAAPEGMPAAPGAPAGPWPPWLAAYARSLRRRLCRRLGMRPAAWPRALTLARPARLWLSEAEWVVEFDLGAHDVAWRLAGLDRDPGWLPSAGCSLRFVFA
jgi:hypothetical protein